MEHRRRTPRIAWLLLLFGAPLLAACGGNTAVQEGAPINAVTTVGMIADVVKNVGGDYVQVTQLMGPGVDPHLYTATESDVDILLNADMIFYNGINLEARMTDVFEQIGSSKPVIAVGDAIPQQRILTEVVYNAPDPHIWMDVELWMMVAEKVRDELIAFDAAHAAAYRENAQAYIAALEELDQYVQDQINRVPSEQRVLVTAHDAFQYFGRAYGIEVFAPQGITTQAEAGVEDIRRTINLVVERQIPAIFVESSVPPDVVEAIVEGARAQGHEVAIGGSLFSDAMGEAGTEEGTYAGMIRHNVDTIVTALLGEATG